MQFEELANYLEKLENIGSRLEMTRILAELFREATSEDGRLIAYISQGMLGPKHNALDSGLADKQVLKAINQAFMLDLDEVTAIFKKAGDMGKAVEEIKSTRIETKNEKPKLSVKEVFEKLVEIARASGTGSQDLKITLLGNLLKELDGKSAKYATKIILGKMRTGFSDMTVLDALSWMVGGDKKLRGDIERIYNVRADLGEVVFLIKENASPEKIAKLRVDPEWGMPILVARAERAKTVEEIWERLNTAAAEHKLDGLRIQAHVRSNSNNEKEVRLFSRGMENVTSMYPDIVEGLKKQVSEECILDGEMIAVDEKGKYLPFQETVQRKRKYDILEMMEMVPLKYFTFDILMLNGSSKLSESNEVRWELLKKTVGSGNTVKLMPRKIVKNPEEIESYFRESLATGTEGIVVKKLEGKYQSGSRDFNWIKYKKSYDETGVADNVDAVVMGYDVGQGKRQSFGIGGFLIGVLNKKTGGYQTIAKIGTGLTDDEWREMKRRCDELKSETRPEVYEVLKTMECDVWVDPKIVVEIKCDEITKSPMHSTGFALRFPRLVNFREMNPEEIATNDEIERLFKLQRGGDDK